MSFEPYAESQARSTKKTVENVEVHQAFQKIDDNKI